MCEMCVTVIYFLLVKLIKFFSLSFFILLPVMVNKDIQNIGGACFVKVKLTMTCISLITAPS